MISKSLSEISKSLSEIVQRNSAQNVVAFPINPFKGVNVFLVSEGGKNAVMVHDAAASLLTASPSVETDYYLFAY